MFDFVTAPDDDNSQQQRPSPPTPGLGIHGGGDLDDSGEFELPNFAPGDEVPEMISFMPPEESDRPPAPSADDYPPGCVAGLIGQQEALLAQTEELWEPAHDLIWAMHGRKEVTVVRHSGDYSLVKAQVLDGSMMVQATVYRYCLKEPKVKFKKYVDLNLEENSNNIVAADLAANTNSSSSNNRAAAAKGTTSGGTLTANFSQEASKQYRRAMAAGNRAFKDKKLDLCLLCYTEAIGLSGIPKMELCRAMAARSAGYLAKGDKEGALEDALGCLRLDPRDVAGYARAGNVYRNMRNYKKAEEYYLHALKLSPNNTDLRLILDSNAACAHFKALGHKHVDVTMLARDNFRVYCRQAFPSSGRMVWSETPQLVVGWPEKGQNCPRGEDNHCSHCFKILHEKQTAMDSVQTEGAKEFIRKHYPEVVTMHHGPSVSHGSIHNPPTVPGVSVLGMPMGGSGGSSGSTTILTPPGANASGMGLPSNSTSMNSPHGALSTTSSTWNNSSSLAVAVGLPAIPVQPPQLASCAHGCGATYCSTGCRDRAWVEYHCIECPVEGRWAKGMAKLSQYLKNAPFACSTIACLFLTVRYLSKMVLTKQPDETYKELAQKTIYLPQVSSGRDKSGDEALEAMVLTPTFELLCHGLSTENGEATGINFLVFKRVFFQMKTAAIGFRVGNWPTFHAKVGHHLDLVNSGLANGGLSAPSSARGGSAAAATTAASNSSAIAGLASASFSSGDSNASAAAAKHKEGLMELEEHAGVYSRCVGVFPVGSCCSRGTHYGNIPLSKLHHENPTSSGTAPPSPLMSPNNANLGGNNKEPLAAANVHMRCVSNVLTPIQFRTIAPLPKGGVAILKTCYDL